ncbi:endogenous retrovirus group PABLB member 1 Env polyprotein-like [Embiotoca jacksoni]|uniref:endogenous retrovirus group PABLB member 1 Env polyprotein-like n=1 Tax=Embiotoca jacksoni TaxID=100190 RepID=UPI003703EE66
MDENPKHSWDTNMWYSYVKALVRSYNKSDCFVCSHMPHSSTQVTLHAKPMNWTEAKCFSSFAGVGYQHEDIIINVTLVKEGESGWLEFTGLKNGTCDTMFWVNFNRTSTGPVVPQKVFLKDNPTFPLCFEQTKGTVFLGNSSKQCQHTYYGDWQGAPVHQKRPSNGTYLVQGGWWLCGTNAYITLPVNWIGVCTPIFVTDHTFIVDKEQTSVNNVRRKRSTDQWMTENGIKPHDGIWGTDVPKEHKLWTDASKVILAFFPQLGVGKVMLRLETVDYRFQVWANASIKVNEGQNREIKALRLMVLQNRMVLDLLTASEGGVCVKIGTTCCTYIPDEVNTNISKAMNVLKQMQSVMTKDHPGIGSWDIYSWLTTGPWWHMLLKIFMPVLMVLIIFCVLISCVIPCLRMMMQKMVANTFFNYMLLQQYERDPPENE